MSISRKKIGLVLVLSLLPGVAALAADQTTPPGLFASGVSAPVTHLYEVTNGAVLRAAALDTQHGTLAERAETHNPHKDHASDNQH